MNPQGDQPLTLPGRDLVNSRTGEIMPLRTAE